MFPTNVKKYFLIFMVRTFPPSNLLFNQIIEVYSTFERFYYLISVNIFTCILFSNYKVKHNQVKYYLIAITHR